MNLADIPDVMRGVLAAAGSALSMLWLKETALFRRLVLFFGGTIFAIVATPDLAKRLNLSANLITLLLGMLSMLLATKLIEAIQSLNVTKLLRDWAYKRAGLPPPTSTRPTPLITRPAPLTKE